jgi:hypothetical protein
MKLMILLIFCFSAFGGNLLILGDSHTVGPFGIKLHKLMSESERFERVVTLGHSSSSSLHWMSETDYKLSGGVFHQFMSSFGEQQFHPNPTHWREKVLVPKLNDVINNPLYHEAWQDNDFSFDSVVIALGANDAAAISNSSGVVNIWEYKKRQKYVAQMLDLTDKNNIKCYWVGPPMGIKKSEANQDVLYKMLEEKIINRCEFFSSNHYKSTGCDGVHFSCPAQQGKAFSWAREVSTWILNN